MATMELLGVEQCLATLHALPPKIQKGALRKATRAGGSVLVKAARREAPARNRTLRRSLTTLLRTYKGVVVAVIGQDKTKADNRRRKIKHSGGISGRGDVTPLHLVERPVKPHRITGSRARVKDTRLETFTVHKDRKKQFTRATSEGAAALAIRRRVTRSRAVGGIVKPLAIDAQRGKVSFRQWVMHPGHAGRHFMRAAAQKTAAAAADAFTTKLAGDILGDASGGGATTEGGNE